MRFSVDPEAYLRAVWTRGLSRYLLFVTLVVLVVVVLLMPLVGGNIGVFVGAVIGVPIGAAASVYTKSRKSVAHPWNTQSFGLRLMSFSSEGIEVVASSGIESKVPWTCIFAGERRSEFVLLYMSTASAYIVPDTAFPTPDDRAKFFDIIEKHVKWQGAQKLRN